MGEQVGVQGEGYRAGRKGGKRREGEERREWRNKKGTEYHVGNTR